MNNESKTLRLIYPQWQGGDIARWIPEIKDTAEAARGYVLGSMLLDFLAPDCGHDKARNNAAGRTESNRRSARP